jgi:hypothetical protein
MSITVSSVTRELLGLWLHETRSLLDYLASMTSPVVQDERDREVVKELAAFHVAEEALQVRVLDVCADLGLRPDQPPYPIEAPTYNFLRTDALGRIFVGLARKDAEVLRTMSARHAGVPDLTSRLMRYIMDDAATLREETANRLAEILGLGQSASVATETLATPAAESAAPAATPTGPAWHDEALSIEERMALAKGLGLFEQLFAAMAQTDCTACGYDCEGYARAIADGSDKDIGKCAPGGDETKDQLKKLLKK